MGDNHNHTEGIKNLKIAFFINLAFTIFEIIGGLYVNSVAILSDAVHDLGDSLSLGTAWYLQHKSKQKANHKFSFGYKRFSLLGALVNSVILLGGSVYVISEAVDRIINPQFSDAKGMFFIALIGVSVNGYAAWKVSKGKTLNERVVSWHLLEDVLGWVAILIASIILQFIETPYLDPALSLLITLYILWNVIKRLKETLYIFLQGNPDEINLEELETEIKNIPEVKSIHHSHSWSLDGENHVFSSHIKLHKIHSLSELIKVRAKIKKKLSTYPFEHCTIETELENEQCEYE